MGDGGNDGYRKKHGIYYQVYAPNEPRINAAKASRKLKEDFKKLQSSGWEDIAEIKEYHFVFNDKYNASTQLLEQAITELKGDNPSVEFKLFLAKDLEKVFLGLEESDILSLGFNIDKRQAVSFVAEMLSKIEAELDREDISYAQKTLDNVSNIVAELDDKDCLLEYGLVKCKFYQKLEKIAEAIGEYKSLTKRYPNDSRAFLYLAEIYLIDKEFDKNLELLQVAKKIDENYWLLELEQLIRKYYLEEQVSIENIDEESFPNESAKKSNFYRLYALFFNRQGDQVTSDQFIEQAIHISPDKFKNYLTKVSILESRLLLEQEDIVRHTRAQELLEEINKIESCFNEGISLRNNILLNVIKLNALRVLDVIPEYIQVSEETLDLSMHCYFDKQIEQVITIVMQFVSLPSDALNKLLQYIISSRKDISDELAKVLIFQFNVSGSLLTAGEHFFNEINNQKYTSFINDLESKNYGRVLSFLEDDVFFAVTLANTLKDFPDLRKKIIEQLPDDGNIQKDKLRLLLNYDEKDFNEALKILKQLDLSELSYLECQPILQIIQEKKAWDFEIIVLKKLIEKEGDKRQRFNLLSQLFNAHFNLKQYPEVIETGKQLLKTDSTNNFLDNENKEKLLANTILSCFERGKVDDSFYVEASGILKKHSLSEPSFEFKISIEAKVYLKNSSPQKALNSVIEGVKSKKILSSQDYAKLYFLLTIEIGNQLELNLDSMPTVEENTFVKLKNKEQWYFIGNENELDALKIEETNNKFKLLCDAHLGEEILIENKYGPSINLGSVEIIFSTEKYIFWQIVQNFQKLSRDGDLEGVQIIEIPQSGESVDLKNLLTMMGDIHKITEPFFDLYCKGNVPLAMLAKSEGGIVNAIGRIQNEQKGFINFSSGTIEDFEAQKELVRSIIERKEVFYIDGTSALFLSEIGYLGKVYRYIPNLKVPQSVINMLGDVSEKLTSSTGHMGFMGYSQGKINFSPHDNEKSESIKNNIVDSIKLLEEKVDNIGVVSTANKVDCMSERELPSALSDACIMAQKENTAVLTEDFLYLKMNELETKKEAPKYFSSLALLRVLYENGHVSFEEYIDYFGYLSTYRFRFLSLNQEDLEKVVFGDKKIKFIKPENIRKLNLPFILSEEYGVPFHSALSVVGGFFFKVIMDNAITTDMTEKIFIEILESFPTKEGKKVLGQIILTLCKDIINKNESLFIVSSNHQVVYYKFEKLLNIIEIYPDEVWVQ